MHSEGKGGGEEKGLLVKKEECACTHYTPTLEVPDKERETGGEVFLVTEF
jgi:hypothetical protein